MSETFVLCRAGRYAVTVRITGGKLTGRRLEVPRRGVRPTQDRVREALFAHLGSAVCGSRFLDLFAGSGSVGIEAWSRGAEDVFWVESQSSVLRVLRRNVAGLTGLSGRVVGLPVERALGSGLAGSSFDMVFADPPYAMGGSPWLLHLFGLLSGPLVTPRTRLIVETDAFCPWVEPLDWVRVFQRRYGGSRLTVLVRGESGKSLLAPGGFSLQYTRAPDPAAPPADERRRDAGNRRDVLCG